MTITGVHFFLILLIFAVIMIVANVYLSSCVVKYDKRKLNKLKQTLREVAFVCVKIAETVYGAGKGEDKYKYVAKRLYDYIPDWGKKLITQEEIDEIIECALNKFKAILKMQEQQQTEETSEEHKSEDNTESVENNE